MSLLASGKGERNLENRLFSRDFGNIAYVNQRFRRRVSCLKTKRLYPLSLAGNCQNFKGCIIAIYAYDSTLNHQ